MEINEKVLDDTKVREARERFEKNQLKFGRKGKLTFDELLDRMTVDGNPFAHIAGEHGVSYHRMQRLFGKYFQHLLPRHKTDREHPEPNEWGFLIGDHASWVEAIIADAQERGFSVERYQSHDPRFAHIASVRSLRRQQIRINNKRCEVHWMTSARRTSPNAKRSYGSFQTMWAAQCDFVFVRQEVNERRTFIIPMGDLRRQYRSERRITVYLPVEKLVVRPGATDWWQYEEAWHLLKA